MKTEKHPTLYRLDGDIVLSAALTPASRQLFRVHKLFLAQHSDVFGGMFQVVSEDHITETYEDVPMVRMPDDDRAEDLAVLLDVIYQPS